MPRGRASTYGDQRAVILARAAALFAAQGYAATSMNQVADATGLSKATLYHYFRDKDALLFTIADEHVSRLEALVDAPPDADADADAEAHLRGLIRRIVLEYAGAQDAHRVLTGDVRFLGDADRRRILDKERRVVDGFAEAIGRWQPAQREAGLTKPLTMLLFGMVNWMFTWMRPDGVLSHEEMAPVVADLFFAGVPGVGRQRTPRKAGRAKTAAGAVEAAANGRGRRRP